MSTAGWSAAPQKAHGCGALYSQKPPIVTASKKPGEWQTYDIIFRAPRFDGNGQVTEKPRATVVQNGVLVPIADETGTPGDQGGPGAAALLLGVLAAAALQNILFKVNALDPLIYFAVAGLLTVVAAASCFVPARRATLVNPIEALRTE